VVTAKYRAPPVDGRFRKFRNFSAGRENLGNSLTGLFFSSIGQELAHFPTPPPVTSQFW